jgi:GNAT superfamily N-acetyltransferase
MSRISVFHNRHRGGPPPPQPSGTVDADADPRLIRDAHLVLLDGVGRGMGLGFHRQPALEPPTDERIGVFGRFDRQARQREFGLQIGVEALAGGGRGRVAWLIDFYIPAGHRGQGHGTELMSGLLDLWARIGIAEARLTSTAEGLAAYESWGFVADRTRHQLDGGLHTVSLPIS